MYLRAVSQAPYTIHAAKSVEHVVPMRLRYKLKTIWQISPIVSPGVNKFRFTRVGVGLGYVEYVDLDGALCSHACVKKEGRKKEREERDVGRLENILSRRRQNRLRFSLHRAARALLFTVISRRGNVDRRSRKLRVLSRVNF